MLWRVVPLIGVYQLLAGIMFLIVLAAAGIHPDRQVSEFLTFEALGRAALLGYIAMAVGLAADGLHQMIGAGMERIKTYWPTPDRPSI